MQILLAITIFGLAVGGLALGILFQRRPLSGSCTRLEDRRAATDPPPACSYCPVDAVHCESRPGGEDQ